MPERNEDKSFDRIGELEWFQAILKGSAERLDNATPDAQTSWYKEHKAAQSNPPQARLAHGA